MKTTLPPVLFKRLPLEYAKSMTSEGTVKVGTLFEYRTVEYDRERRDQGEGKLRLHSDAGHRVYNSTEELPPVLRERRMSIQCGPGGFATTGENAVVLNSDGTDMFIYCMSEELIDQEALQAWGGACVRIFRVPEFMRALDTALRCELERQGRRVAPVRVARCTYEDRRHNWHRPLPPPWLLKPACFSHQREYRAAWSVDNARGLAGVVVQAPTIASFCELAVQETPTPPNNALQPAPEDGRG